MTMYIYCPYELSAALLAALQTEGGGSGKSARQRSQPAAGLGAEINPFVGRKVKRYWPRDGGWFDGIISDYNAATGEHW